MVKRSREDFDPSPEGSPEREINTASGSEVISVPEGYEPAKFLHLDNSGQASSTPGVMRCSLPPHRQTLSFDTYEDYEVHYNKIHVNRCVECRKNFPTPHFLNLHQAENHNPLIEVLKDRGERTYACFVEDCDRKCSNPTKRRLHLIDKHMFPKDYDFQIVDEGIDQRSSMLRSGRHRRRSSAAQHKIDLDDRARRRTSTLGAVPGDEDKETTADNKISEEKQCDEGTSCNHEPSASGSSVMDPEIDGLTGAMSALKFLPSSVRFGRGKGRGGFSKS